MEIDHGAREHGSCAHWDRRCLFRIAPDGAGLPVAIFPKKWDGFLFDMLKHEYMKLRKSLLEKVLGDKINEYLSIYSMTM